MTSFEVQAGKSFTFAGDLGEFFQEAVNDARNVFGQGDPPKVLHYHFSLATDLLPFILKNFPAEKKEDLQHIFYENDSETLMKRNIWVKEINFMNSPRSPEWSCKTVFPMKEGALMVVPFEEKRGSKEEVLQQLNSENLKEVLRFRARRLYFSTNTSGFSVFVEAVKFKTDWYLIGTLSLRLTTWDFEMPSIPALLYSCGILAPVRSKVIEYLARHQSDNYGQLIKLRVVPDVNYHENQNLVEDHLTVLIDALPLSETDRTKFLLQRLRYTPDLEEKRRKSAAKIGKSFLDYLGSGWEEMIRFERMCNIKVLTA